MTESRRTAACRVLTPPGRAAIAVLQLQCTADTAELTFGQCFATNVPVRPESAPIGRIIFGQWNGEDVVVVRSSEDVWEIHCHGGHAAVEAVIHSLQQQADLVVAEPPDSDTSAFADQPPLEADLLKTLVRTRTRRTASCVVPQLNGLLRSAIVSLLNSVDDQSRFHSQLAELLVWRRFAEHLVEPWRVIVLGAPNVGKSSLVNAILGYARSIVFDEPGTTRDVIEAETFIDGWPFLLCDSAGLRDETADELEREGITRVHTAASRCDALLLVADATQAAAFRPPEVLASLPQIPRAVVWNKVDLLPEGERSSLMLESAGLAGSRDVLLTSAKNRTGIDELREWLSRTLVSELPADTAPVPAGALIRQTLAAAGESFEIGKPADAAAALRELLGQAPVRRRRPY